MELFYCIGYFIVLFFSIARSEGPADFEIHFLSESRGCTLTDDALSFLKANKDYLVFKFEYGSRIVEALQDFDSHTGLDGKLIASSMLRYSTTSAEALIGSADTEKNESAHPSGALRPEVFRGMLSLADKYPLKGLALRNLTRGLLKHILTNEESGRKILEHCVEHGYMGAQTRTARMMLCEFLLAKKIFFTISDKTLELGTCEDVRSTCSQLLYNGWLSEAPKPSSTYAESYLDQMHFVRVKMRDHPLSRADVLSSYEKHILLSLIGMVSYGDHVISLNCAAWLGGGLRSVFKAVNVRNIGGISSLASHNHLELERCLETHIGEELLENIKYMEFSLPPLMSDAGELLFPLKTRKMLALLKKFTLAAVRIKCSGLLNEHFDEILQMFGTSTRIDIFDLEAEFRFGIEKKLQSLAGAKIDNLVLSFSQGTKVRDALAGIVPPMRHLKGLYFDCTWGAMDFLSLSKGLKEFAGLESLAIDLTWEYDDAKEQIASFVAGVSKLKALNNLIFVVDEASFDSLRCKLRNKSKKNIVFVVVAPERPRPPTINKHGFSNAGYPLDG